MNRALLALAAGVLSLARGSQDPGQKLKEVLQDSKVHASWIYNDFSKGSAEGRKSGKPIVVVFR